MNEKNWKCWLGLHAWKKRDAGFGHQMRRSCKQCGGLQELAKRSPSGPLVWQWK